MGTRCDFYEGLGERVVWCGALARDGYEDVVGEALGGAVDLDEYRSLRDGLIAHRRGIPASAGWPWPWKDSTTTDVVVTYADGGLWLLDGAFWVSYKDPEQRVVARLPDMLTKKLSTPAGRVDQQMRDANPELFKSLEHDVALAVLVEAVRHFLKLAVHLQAVPGGYRTTERDSSRRYDLLMFQQGLRRCDADLQEVLAQRARTVNDGIDFRLLGWMRDHLSDFDGGRSELIDVSDDTPFLYGLPLPRSMDEQRPRQMMLTTYDGLLGRRLRLAFSYLESLMPAFAPVRAQTVAYEVTQLGRYLFKGVEPREWLELPREELAGRSISDACQTEEGYAACRLLLQSLWLK